MVITTKKPRQLVALSAGGTNHELAEHGLGVEHISELMVRVSRRLLSNGHRLAFGGTIKPGEKTLTESLMNAATGWAEDASDNSAESDDTKGDDAGGIDVTSPTTWPMVNYSAWPFHTKITPEHRAASVGICEFVDINPPGFTTESLKGAVDNWPAKPQSRIYLANALTQMRDDSAKASAIRMVWGGRIVGAIGWMAGILEEVSFSLQHERTVVIFGGFGGCGSRLAGFLSNPKAPWPSDLSLEACKNTARDELFALSTEHDALQKRFSDFKQQLVDYRAVLHTNSKDINGVQTDLLKSALNQTSLTAAVNIAAETVRQIDN